MSNKHEAQCKKLEAKLDLKEMEFKHLKQRRIFYEFQ